MSLRYVIIDDSLFVRELMKSAVEAYGLKLVGETESCEEGAQLIASYRPQIAIIDLVLPNKSGLEFIGEVSHDNPNISIIACSTLTSEDIKRRSYLAGAKFFLEKPFTRESIGEAIHAAISTMTTKGGKSG
jgi:two-component system chemotaxis response regulator CheY